MDQPAAQPQPLNQPPATTKKRGDNFVMAEDEQLAISWLAISQDAVFSNNQSGAEFYEKLGKHFRNVCTIFPRTDNQLKYRWKAINTSTLRFAGIYRGIERNPPSGTAPSDYMEIAKKEYYRDTKGSHFRDEAPWQILRYAPKWAGTSNSAAANTSTANPFSGISSPATSRSTPPPESLASTERPVGQKKAKRQRDDREIEIERNNELKRATDIQERKAVVMENGQKLAERALKLEEEAKTLTTLMTSAESCPDEESREILKLMKARLLKKYRDEEAQEGN